MKKEFTHIYDKELWGKGKGSGPGSSLLVNKKYISFLESFLKFLGPYCSRSDQGIQ